MFVDLRQPNTVHTTVSLPLEAALLPQKHDEHQSDGVFAKHAADHAAHEPEPAVVLGSIEHVVNMGSNAGQVLEGIDHSHNADPSSRHHAFGYGLLSFGGWRRGSWPSVDGARSTGSQRSSLDNLSLGFAKAAAALPQRASLDSPRESVAATAAVQQRSSLDSPRGSVGAATTAHRDMTLSGFLQQHGASDGLEKHSQLGVDPGLGLHHAVSPQAGLASPTSPRAPFLTPKPG